MALLLQQFEAPREAKFEGTLTPAAELERLVERRPSYVGPVIVMAAGGTLMVPAILLWSAGLAASAVGGGNGAPLAILGLITGGVGIAAVVVAGVVLIVFAVVRADLDPRIRELEKLQQGEPGRAPPAAQPPSVNAAPVSPLVLARF